MQSESKKPVKDPDLSKKNIPAAGGDIKTDSTIAQDVDDKLIGDDKELDEVLQPAKSISDKPGMGKNNY